MEYIFNTQKESAITKVLALLKLILLIHHNKNKETILLV